jgi:2-hydroxy-4-carboxymuconate semialdehyde hemiacetal dehydrogenase
MKICMVGEGAFGKKHLAGLKSIEDVEVVSLVGGVADVTEAVAQEFSVPHWTTDLGEGLSRADAAILATPTPIHASQAIEVMQAGKHVEVEIPMAESLADAERVVAVQQETGLVAMAGHTRRFNPSHQWLYKRLQSGELKLQHLDVQTFFFRRSNLNAEGKPRSWTDHLLWHHACHTVDLFQYQTGEVASEVQAMQGPMHPELGIAMDMSLFGTFFRYICDNGTYIARYDDLVDGYEKPIDVSKVDVSMSGIELQDREFITAIREGREPRASVTRVLPAMETLHRLELALG